MNSLQIIFSAATASIPKKAALQRSIKFSSPRAVFQPAAAAAVASSISVRNVRPPITSFKPCSWGHIFTTFSFDEQLQKNYCKEIDSLLKEARNALMAANSTKLMVLIDTLERLGLAYHFETEIDEKLQQLHDSVDENCDNDLFTTSLRFRLLRQHRYHVSCDVFDKFVDKDNKLKEGFCNDIEGVLSLYEAAHIRIHDENILDEAVAFTTHRLSNILPELESPMREKVQQALDYPVHKSLIFLNISCFISIYEKEDSRDELLLRLAKINFNFLQNMYRNELFQLSIWWKKLDLNSKLPYSRNRLVVCYLWGMVHHFEPQYSSVRMTLGKVYQLMTILDDTYDNYATLEEIELFTRAVERWNADEIDELPDYMKIVYKSIMNVSEDIERVAEQEEKSFVIPYFIEAIKQLCRAYGKEQEWIMKRELPSFEDFLIHGRITGLMYVTCTALLPGIKSATKETVDWLISEPKIFVFVADIGRLHDDMASHQRESREGSMLTMFDCYMRDKGVSEEEARGAYSEMIEDKRKHLNAEWVKSRSMEGVAKEIMVIFISLMQATEVTYKNAEDGVTSPDNNLNPLVAALLLDPIHLF